MFGHEFKYEGYATADKYEIGERILSKVLLKRSLLTKGMSRFPSRSRRIKKLGNLQTNNYETSIYYIRRTSEDACLEGRSYSM